MPRYIKAEPGPKNTVIYTDEDGNRVEFSGGDRTWRNQNPGNLVPGNVSRRNGQIGVAGGFAIFPNYETGHKALIDSLKSSHGEKDLVQMIRVYAPKHENKTAVYLRFLRKKTGVKDNRKIKDFSPAQFEKLWKAVEQMEGRKPGKMRVLPTKKEISRIRKNKKGTIVAYFIDGLGWVSKAEGIRLCRAGQLDAVLARSRSGNPYLRTPPDAVIENNLEARG